MMGARHAAGALTGPAVPIVEAGLFIWDIVDIGVFLIDTIKEIKCNASAQGYYYWVCKDTQTGETTWELRMEECNSSSGSTDGGIKLYAPSVTTYSYSGGGSGGGNGGGVGAWSGGSNYSYVGTNISRPTAITAQSTVQCYRVNASQAQISFEDGAVGNYVTVSAEDSENICAYVAMEFKQTAVMSREGFEGTLTVMNNNATAIENFTFTATVLDSEGNDVSDLFEINYVGTDGFTTTVNGNETLLSLSGGSAGSFTVLYIPGRNTATEGPEYYQFTGTMTYFDQTGGDITIDLSPVTLTVNPSPSLKLYYFMERDVYSDDPNTLAIESAVPAEISVLVVNNGLGDAKNFTLSGFTPSVVENEKGLLLDYTMTEAALNGKKTSGTLDVDFGTVAGHSAAVAQWWYTANLQGHYSDMSVAVSQLDYSYTDLYGNTKVVPAAGREDIMLIEGAEIHELIRSVQADGDGLPDFLADDLADDAVLPDTLYLSTGEILDVNNVLDATVNGNFGAQTATITVTATEKAGWNYLRLLDPGDGDYTLTSVVRNGVELNSRNFWQTDRYFVDTEGAKLQNRVHILDYAEKAGTARYTLTYVAKPSDPLEVVSITQPDSVVSTALSSLTVTFSKAITAESFTAEDVALYRQGKLSENLINNKVTIKKVNATTYTINGLSSLTAQDGYYQLVVRTDGILDATGAAGSTGKAATWTKATSSPAVVAVTGLDALTNVKANSVEVEFNIGLRELTKAAIAVNGAAVPNVTIQAIGTSSKKFKISGLAQYLKAGENVLTINTPSLASVNGVNGFVAYTQKWTVDQTAPTAPAEDTGLWLVAENPAELFVELSEAVTADVSALTLKKNGKAITAGSLSMTVEGGKLTVSGLAKSLTDGDYELVLNMSKVKDLAGNAGQGTYSWKWTLDATPAAVLSDLRLDASCDWGTADGDNKTASKELRLLATLPESGLSVRIFHEQGTQRTLVYNNAKAGSSLDASVDVTGGSCKLIVELTDGAGNVSESALDVFVDDVAFTANFGDDGHVNNESASVGDAYETRANEPKTVTIGFSDVIGGLDMGDFSLTINGKAASLAGAVLTQKDDKTWEISNISEEENGTYCLTLDLTGTYKVSTGLVGSGTAQFTWEVSDRPAPEVTSCSLADGVALESLDRFDVSFSLPMDCEALIESGLITQAVRLAKVDADGKILEIIRLKAEEFTYAECDNTLTWTADEALSAKGRLALLLDTSLLRSQNGKALNHGIASSNACIRFTEMAALNAGVGYSFAVPVWHDINGDGLNDLLIGEKTAASKGQIRVYLNHGTAQVPLFADYTYLQGSNGAWSVTADNCLGVAFRLADVNGDGMEDLVYGTYDGKILWSRRNANGTYGSGTALKAGGVNIDVGDRAVFDIYDWNGDGKLDIISGAMDGKVYLYVNNGSWTFAAAQTLNIQVAEGRSAISVADLNGDGLADIVSGDTKGNLYAFLNNGDNSFSMMKILDGTTDRSRPFVADVTGDGVPDIGVGYADGSVSVLIGEKGQQQQYLFTVNDTTVFAATPQATVNGQNVVISWTLIAGADATGCKVRVGDMVYVVTMEGREGSLSLQDVEVGSHAYQVCVVDSTGLESWSARQTFTIGDTEPPQLTGEPTIVVNENVLSFSWNAATDNVGVTGYRIDVNGTIYETSKLSHRVTVHAVGDYVCRVGAVDGAGNVAWSESQNVTVTVIGTGDDIVLSGMMPTANYGAGCVAASVGMLLAYYDANEYCGFSLDSLIEGDYELDARGLQDAYLNTFIASSDFTRRFVGKTIAEERDATFDTATWTLNTAAWDSLADWLGTSQIWRGSEDRATAYYLGSLKWLMETDETYTVMGQQLAAKYADFKYGLAQYVASRGYELDAEATMTIKADTQAGGSFSFEQFMSEIDAGRGVLISLKATGAAGHMVVAYGYNEATGEIIFDDTSSSDCRMAWDGTYTYAGHQYSIDAATTIVFKTTTAPEDLVATVDGLGWTAVEGASGYIVEYSQDGFATVIRVVTETVGTEHYNVGPGTWQWRVRTVNGTEWSVGEAFTVAAGGDGLSVVTATEDGVKDVFFVKPIGVWSDAWMAEHMGVNNVWQGTGESVVFGGENRFGDIFEGSTDENVLLLTDDANGDALFVYDIYTESPDDLAKFQSRLANIKEIRAGAGDDIVDMTSDAFDYLGDGLSIHGGLGDDTLWSNKGDNTLFGDAGNDRLVGAGGNDVLVGGLGNDSMHGGGGTDVFAFGDYAWGHDTVEQLPGGDFRLWFADGMKLGNAVGDIKLTQDGDDVVVQRVGTDSKVTVKGFTKSQVSERLLFGDAGFNGLDYANLSAMGVFSPSSTENVFEDKNRGYLA